MATRVQTVAFQGIEAVLVDVQVQVVSGLPNLIIVGLPDKAVRESGQRVHGALTASGLSLPPRRIIVNLAPADLPKEGSHYDLPIALALMAAIGAIPSDAVNGFLALGELGLDGRLAATAGVLPAAIAAHANGLGVICPEPSGSEAAWAGEDIDIVAAGSLLALVNHLGGYQLCARPVAKKYALPAGLPDLSEVRGQDVARRALEVAAAGGHNLLLLCNIKCALEPAPNPQSSKPVELSRLLVADLEDQDPLSMRGCLTRRQRRRRRARGQFERPLGCRRRWGARRKVRVCLRAA